MPSHFTADVPVNQNSPYANTQKSADAPTQNDFLMCGDPVFERRITLGMSTLGMHDP